MFKTVHLQQVKKGAKFLARYVKRVPFANRRYKKGEPVSIKMVYKSVKG